MALWKYARAKTFHGVLYSTQLTTPQSSSLRARMMDLEIERRLRAHQIDISISYIQSICGHHKRLLGDLAIVFSIYTRIRSYYICAFGFGLVSSCRQSSGFQTLVTMATIANSRRGWNCLSGSYLVRNCISCVCNDCKRTELYWVNCWTYIII